MTFFRIIQEGVNFEKYFCKKFVKLFRGKSVVGLNANLSPFLPIFVSRPFRYRTPNAGLLCAVIPCCQSYSWPWFLEHEHSAINFEMF